MRKPEGLTQTGCAIPAPLNPVFAEDFARLLLPGQLRRFKPARATSTRAMPRTKH